MLLTPTVTDELRRRMAEKRANDPKARYDTQSRMVEEFDARDYLGTSTQGAFDLIRPQLAEDLGRLRGEQVGMGRLNSGFATQDEDRLITRALQDLNARVNASALQAGSLDLQARGLAGDYLSGRMDRDQAAANAKRKKRSGFLGFLGTVAGGVIGGAPGAAIGGSAGEFLGGMF